MTQSRVEVASLVGQLDRMFEETTEEFGRLHWHSLIRNLSTVRPEDWDALHPGGGRTIRELVMHIGTGFPFWANHAFGDGTREWSDKVVNGVAPGLTPDEMTTWLRAGYAEFRKAVVVLTDGNLSDICARPWDGPAQDARRIIEGQIQHTLYHVGEINHLRALLQGNDDWDHQDMGREDVP